VADERVLSQRELNRALLARQLLLERTHTTLPDVLERMGGLQAQYAPAMYVGVWSRLEGFQRDDLTRALEQRRVVQGTLLRVTIHLVSAGDYWSFVLPVREARRTWWLRAQPQADRPTAAGISEAADRLRDRLQDGPAKRAEIETLLGKTHAAGVGLWLDLVRVPPSGTWERRRADLFDTAETWLGPPTVGQEDAAEVLIRRYLGGFGPARPSDIATWAGLPVKEVTSVLDRLSLQRFRDESGQLLVDLPDGLLPPADTVAPVRFLSVWDASLLVHARGKAILPEEYRPTIFHTKNPHSVSTFLVDGAVAGSWRYDQGEIVVEPFRPLRQATRRAVREEADRLAVLHAG
jgi:hypothetical protein